MLGMDLFLKSERRLKVSFGLSIEQTIARFQVKRRIDWFNSDVYFLPQLDLKS